MQAAGKQLEIALTESGRVYAELLAAAKASTELLVAGDTQGLLAKTVEAEGLLQQADVLQKQWLDALQRLQQHLGLPASAPLSEVVGRLEDRDGPLHAALKSLRQSTVELQAVGGTNSELLQQALEYVRFSLRVLTDAAGIPPYADGGQGKPMPPTPPGVVDLRG